MTKKIYVSADRKKPCDSNTCDKTVADRIRKWGDDSCGIDIVCTDDVHSSITVGGNCRCCEIKQESKMQITKSDTVIFVVGEKTAAKKAGWCDGRSCSPAYSGMQKSPCTKAVNDYMISGWRDMSYLKYEITAAVLSGKEMLIVYDSANDRECWVPSWYNDLCDKYDVRELCRIPFWLDTIHTKDRCQDIRRYLE